MRPVRLRPSRVKGFNLQEHSRAVNGLPAVNCARPSKFGNPFTVKQAREIGLRVSDAQLAEHCVRCFKEWLKSGGTNMYWMGAKADVAKAKIRVFMPQLRGKNLACWCALDAPCHADVLLELANRPTCEEVAP